MDFTYDNQGTITYLVYQINNTDTIDSMSLGMLTNNKIPGLAPAVFTQMDTVKYMKYNVSAKIPVKQFFTGAVNKKRLLGVFSGITDAMLSAEDYMIDASSILLDLDYIFTDVSTCETILVCLPLKGEGQEAVELGAFFKNIMFTTQFDQTENCDHVAKLINYLNSTPVFSLVDFKGLLEEIKGNAQAVVQPAMVSPAMATAAQPSLPVQQEPYTAAQPVISSQPLPPPQPSVPPQPVYPPQPAAPPRQVSPPQPSVSPQPVPPSQPVVSPQPVSRPSALPPSQTVQSMPGPSHQTESAENGKKMSMLGLMMHYSKENAAIYKEQKAEKKAKPAKAAKTAKPAKAAKTAKKGKTVPADIAMPSADVSFAIPGQSPSPVQTTVQSTPSGQSTVQPSAMPIQSTSQPAVPPAPQPATQPPSYTQAVPQGQTMNFGETTVLSQGNIGETTVLSAIQDQTASQPYLIRSRNNEKIMLDKPVYRIGKEKSYVDYFVSDNTAVSRSHANIINRDGVFYVMDTNSTNHTYVNGVMIQSNLETKLEQGTKIRLANEEFVFYLH